MKTLSSELKSLFMTMASTMIKLENLGGIQVWLISLQTFLKETNQQSFRLASSP